ncbi:MAG: MBL fold metallo-hydrolase [Candidatus Poribacteria bacterium]
MIITLWGVRGSIPTPIVTEQYQAKVKNVLRQAHGQDLSDEDKIASFVEDLPKQDRNLVGGDTTCIEISDDETCVIIDAGSGIRRLGMEMMKGGRYTNFGGAVHLLFTHHHHDHTCGFPFFVPGFLPTSDIRMHGLHSGLEGRMAGLQVAQYFPVPLEVMPSKKTYHRLTVDTPYRIGEFTITPTELNHPGDTYGYRIEWRDKVFVMASDTEFKNPDEETIAHFTNFFRDADVLYFDGQYTVEEAFVKEDWGHSSAMHGIDLSVPANVKRLVVGHHDPAYDDPTIFGIEETAEQYRDLLYPDATLVVEAAIQGATYDFSG